MPRLIRPLALALALTATACAPAGGGGSGDDFDLDDDGFTLAERVDPGSVSSLCDPARPGIYDRGRSPETPTADELVELLADEPCVRGEPLVEDGRGDFMISRSCLADGWAYPVLRAIRPEVGVTAWSGPGRGGVDFVVGDEGSRRPRFRVEARPGGDCLAELWVDDCADDSEVQGALIEAEVGSWCPGTAGAR